ncbi:MAG: alanine--tRNA ligase [Candidatus Levybacteria bacterium]|nr:alanine--tRNA ligase [Candidatus Levybacteria bacterium]
MTAQEIIKKYISFFEKRNHKRISNAPLVPENDPTTLFTSSGMQPLVAYLLGEPHPQGKRLVNVQNSFRAQDIEEIGDNRHTTFFRMLGNWSLGDYFKKEQIPWIFEFITKELGIPSHKLYATVFKGYKDIAKDRESEKLWIDIFTKEGLNPKERIFFYDTKNWWSRAGEPDNMPPGEPGGPDSEIFYLFDTLHDAKFGRQCHPNCQCGRFMEIVNSVFMEYQKEKDGSFRKLPQKNVDHGAGVERLLAAVENQQDVFQTSLFAPIIKAIEKITYKRYQENKKEMRIIADHMAASVFIVESGVLPSNKEHGYILRRLIRRALDNINVIRGFENMMVPTRAISESIIENHKDTDPQLEKDSQRIINTILEETNNYRFVLTRAQRFIKDKYKIGDELKGQVEIDSDDAFFLYSSHGLSPTQIKNLGYVFDEQKFAEKMKKHQRVSRKGASKKFAGGLADHSEKTIMGHTATHLLHQAIRDVLGNRVHQTGSNITTERIRFDFNYDNSLTLDELKKVEEIVNKKILENLPVHFEMLPLKKAKKLGAIGLFDEKYGDKVKVYFIGNYSKEFCGGPHVEFTSKLKKFTIIKQENIGQGKRRIYSKVS